MQQGRPLFERLHQATRLAHRRLERRVDMYGRNLDLHKYRRLLQVLWGFYQPLERKLVVLADHILLSSFAQQRRKAPLLKQDLLSLGMAESSIDALPLCGRLPALPTLAHVFGVLYAIDGSAWGNRIATRYLVEDTLGITSSHGGSFFFSLRSSQDPLVNNRCWQDVVATTAAVEGPEVEDSAIQSALDTFECFETWLAHQERSPCAHSARTNSLRWSSLWEPELFCAERFGDIRVA
jgi:heme oxygenase (biliverdin-IX-beta and delta-forming)